MRSTADHQFISTDVDELDALLVLAGQGCTDLFAAQQAALAAP